MESKTAAFAAVAVAAVAVLVARARGRRDQTEAEAAVSEALRTTGLPPSTPATKRVGPTGVAATTLESALKDPVVTEQASELLVSLHLRGELREGELRRSVEQALDALEPRRLSSTACLGLLCHLVAAEVLDEEVLERLPASVAPKVDKALRGSLRMLKTRRRIRRLLAEFHWGGDARCFMDQVHASVAPHYRHEIVKKLVQTTLGKTATAREQASALLRQLVHGCDDDGGRSAGSRSPVPGTGPGAGAGASVSATALLTPAGEPCDTGSYTGPVLTQDQVAEGFLRTLHGVSEMRLDAPHACDVLARFIARAMVDGLLPESFLDDVPAPVLAPTRFDKKSVLPFSGRVEVPFTPRSPVDGSPSAFGFTGEGAAAAGDDAGTGGGVAASSASRLAGLRAGVTRRLSFYAVTESAAASAVAAARVLLPAAYPSDMRAAARSIRKVWGLAVGRPVADMKRETASVVRDYLLDGDLAQAVDSINALHAPDFHHDVVKRVCVLAIEAASDAACSSAAKLLVELRNRDVISDANLHKGLVRLLEALDDLALDVPKAAVYAAHILIAVADEGDGYLRHNAFDPLPESLARRHRSVKTRDAEMLQALRLFEEAF